MIKKVVECDICGYQDEFDLKEKITKELLDNIFKIITSKKTGNKFFVCMDCLKNTSKEEIIEALKNIEGKKFV